MTNDRIWSESAVQWTYCPWCGRELREDQNLNLLVWTDNGIDHEASEKNGYNFNISAKSCGYDIRIWAPEESDQSVIE